MKRAALGGVGVLASLLVVASVALATHRPAAGVLVDAATANSVNFNQGEGPIKLRTQGSVRFRVAHVVTPAGPPGPPVWHTHPGPEILAVNHGTITITKADCEQVTIGPGEAYIAPPDTPFAATFNSSANPPVSVDFTATHLLPMPPAPGTPGVPITAVPSPC